ncbi:MAG: carboxypeptidase regulatory-like domain-containing protein [Lachnospiraceae bacterium]|nr:carboxypeptidase regulatory-like domain-containing protein [Lachnospiraceae bacterium]
MSTETEKKRKKDQFSVTVVGIVIYSVLLIGIVAGTYLGIKTFYRNHQKKVDEAVAQAEEEIEARAQAEAAAITEVEEAAEPEPEPEAAEEEEVLPEKLVDVTGIVNAETREIDYSQTVAEPGKRDAKNVWKDSVFSKLENVQNPAEAPINTYDFSRRFAFVNTDKKLEFMIYTNPETEKAEKITTKEYCGEDVEVINYYYNNGNINYVSQYRQAVDIPVNPSTRSVQARYYFSKDTLVKYIYCEEEHATEYNVSDMDKYSEGTIAQYDFLESDIINRAYINYNVVKLLPEAEKAEGYIMDEFNSALNEVDIIITDQNGNEVTRTHSNEDGYYSLELPIDDAAEYTLCAQKSSLDSVEIHNIRAPKGCSVYAVEPIYMAYTETGAIYNVQILVREAANATSGLPDATIRIRNGINNRDGEAIATGVLDATGAITAPLKAGCYTAEVQKGGYETCYFTIIVKADHQAVLGYAVADVGENEVVTTLSWDSTPLDLDLRMFSSGGARVNRSGLDSVGSTMAEMIRTTQLGSDTFECYVSDYSNCTGGDLYSYSMAGSNAYVSVYSADGLQAQFHVPLAHMGIVWKPFEIRNARILPLNDYYYHTDEGSIWMSKQ